MEKTHQPLLLPSPTAHSTGSSSTGSRITTTSNPHPPPLPPQQPITPQKLRPITRFDASNPYPTTFIQADPSSFKQVVQMLTGAPPSDTPKPVSSIPPVHYHHHNTHPKPDPNIQWSNQHNPPIIKSLHMNQSSGFKLYQRRQSSNNMVINPINRHVPSNNYGFSGKPEILSPSILDFPSLVLSPVTPLIPDPFEKFGSGNNEKSKWWFMNSPTNNGGIDYNNNNNNNNNNNWELDTAAEEKAIKEKGFFLHPSPGATPRGPEPRLLPLFPVTSSRASG